MTACLTLDNLALATPDGKPLFDNLTVSIGRECVGLVGRNGSGKSTLLNLIRGRIAPASGTVTRLTSRIAILDQHVAVFDPGTSLLENVRALLPALNENDIRARLARFAFRGDAALQPVATLSGGERLRAGLAVAFAGGEPPELLLLDEPTNHLDIESVELLEAALKAWTGAIIVISHDTAFLNAIGVQNVITL